MLVINGRFLTLPGGGVRRYALELCQALCTEKYDVLVAAPPDAPDVPGIPMRRTGIFRGHIWEQAELSRFLIKQGLPVLINPANTGPLHYPNNIIILHDMAWYYKKQAFSPMLYRGYRHLIPALVKHAMAVGTVSDFSAKEIEKVFPSFKSKVFVAPPSLEYLATWKRELPKDRVEAEPRDFYLTVGLTADRKDAPTLFKAFAVRSDLKLIVAGFRNKVLKKLKNLPENVKLVERVSDAELAWLYSRCRAVISASCYEGFDLPPLEAAWFGRPAILSDIPVHRDVWGSSAIYFRLGDAEDLTEKLDQFTTVPGNILSSFARSFNRQRLLQAFTDGLNRTGITIR
jgi:glycosyltransferase involved in cell wall biosynthesis